MTVNRRRLDYEIKGDFNFNSLSKIPVEGGRQY